MILKVLIQGQTSDSLEMDETFLCLVSTVNRSTVRFFQSGVRLINGPIEMYKFCCLRPELLSSLSWSVDFLLLRCSVGYCWTAQGL